MNDHYAPGVEHLRIPPHSIDAEQSVLGALMLTSVDTFEKVADIITEDDFYRRDHQLIFRAIRELADGKPSKPYDAVTVGDWFESMRLSDEVAGGAYLIDLVSGTPSAANIVAYARIVKDKATLRRMIDVGTTMVNNGYMPEGRDTVELLAAAETDVLAIGDEVKTDIFTGADGLRATAMELSRRRLMGPNELLGISTSLDAVDDLTCGMQPSDLIVLAARPSMGKTALMLQEMWAAAASGKRPYGIELEMNQSQVYMRHISRIARIDFSIVQRPARASEMEMQRMRDAIGKLRALEWWLDCSAGLNIDMICARIRRMKKKHNIGIAYIDYLQYIDYSRQLKYTNATGAIQEITRKLKGLAKELNIPVVLLSQLNRALEQRGSKRPILSDLRESGAIEQDADVVKFVHREGYYEDWPRDDPRQKLAEIIVAKARNGIVDTAMAQWEGKYQSFSNLAYDNPANYYNPQQTSSKGGFEPVPMHGLVQPIKVNQSDED